MSLAAFAEPTISVERVDVSPRPETITDQQHAEIDDSGLTLLQFALSVSDAAVICDLGEHGYGVLRPISYEIERISDTNFLASFEEANIAVGGFDPQDAYQALVAEILDTFDALTNEAHLGPDAAAQLEIMRTYIVKA